MKIRPYSTKDKEQVLGLLRLNIPKYFAPSEEADFIDYLDHALEDYFVVELNGVIVGCGGVNYIVEDSEARISWDMIHPDFHGKGIGKQLTKHRIECVKQLKKSSRIVVRTSQLAYKFYEKMGFTLERQEADYWAEGFHLYYMSLPLNQT